MSAILNQLCYTCVENPEIEQNASWLGKTSGLTAEKMLRGINKPYLYVLRAGENESDYYATFIHADGTIRHQPFVITFSDHGWCYEQGGYGGPFINKKIDEVVHMIIHCEEGECTPLINFNK